VADLKPIFRRYWHHDLQALFPGFISLEKCADLFCRVNLSPTWEVSHAGSEWAKPEFR
jgi:hypothetical protein